MSQRDTFSQLAPVEEGINTGTDVVSPSSASPVLTGKGKPKIITGRPANACARCKSRKIKCSYERPNCAACLKAKVECDYPSSDKSIWDYARSLEHRLKILEESLASDSIRPFKRQRTSVSIHETPRSVILDSVEAQKTPSSNTEILRRNDERSKVGPPSSSQALDRIPTAAVDLVGLRLDSHEPGDSVLQNDLIDFDLSSIPPLRKIEDVLDHFFQVIHPPHPIFHEPTFRASIEVLYHLPGPKSAQLVYQLYLILALHTVDHIRRSSNPEEFRLQARDYYDTAMLFLEPARKGSPLGKLQGMLLRQLFVFRVPAAGDIWDHTGRAVRAAVDLGLHLDPDSSVRSGLSPTEMDVRRKLFWTTYVLDRTISIALGRPCGFDTDWISTQFPSLSPDDSISTHRILDGAIDHRKESGIHHAKYRLIQSDIHARLFAVSASRSPPPHPEWFEDIHRRLSDWRTNYSPVQGEYLSDNWIDLHYQLLLSMLYRPSPGNPRPSREFLTNAVRAAGSIIRIHKTMWRQSAFVNLWLTIHHEFMAGVTYLNCLWNANSQNWLIVPSYVDALLDIQTCSQLLEAMTAREPGTERMRDAFETVSAAIIRRMSSQTGPLPMPTQSVSYTGPDVLSSHRPGSDRSTSFDMGVGVPPWITTPSRSEQTGSVHLNVDPVYPTSNVEITPGMMDTLESFFSNPYTDLSAFQGFDFSVDGLFGDAQQG